MRTDTYHQGYKPMSSILDGVNRRTQLAGYNRLELLLFFLDGGQHYGISVFKVHEVIQRPPMTRAPNANPTVVGMATLRGKTIPVLDLALAVGHPPMTDSDQGIVIVTEYNRSIQGFLVRAVDRIVNINWENVVPPPEGAGNDHFLTAIAHVDKHMVEMIDVEKVLGSLGGGGREYLSDEYINVAESAAQQNVVLVVDDSSVARKQNKHTHDRIGAIPVLTNNGKEAYDLLMRWASTDDPHLNNLLMVISDIEKPEMDGYTLTTKIRSEERMRGLYVMLQTSLSGLFNHYLIRRVDDLAIMPKFDAKDLASAVLERIKARDQEPVQAA